MYLTAFLVHVTDSFIPLSRNMVKLKNIKMISRK